MVQTKNLSRVPATCAIRSVAGTRLWYLSCHLPWVPFSHPRLSPDAPYRGFETTSWFASTASPSNILKSIVNTSATVSLGPLTSKVDAVGLCKYLQYLGRDTT